MAPKVEGFRFDPSKNVPTSPSKFVNGIGDVTVTVIEKNKPTYNMRFDGKLPETEAEAAACAKALRAFLIKHPSIAVLPSHHGNEKELMAALTKSFQRGGVMYEKLASRLYTLGTVLDLSRDDTVKAVPTDSISSVPNAGPSPGAASTPPRVKPATTFDLSKLDADGKAQAAAYTTVRTWIDAQIAQIDRTKPATTDLAVNRRILVELRDRCDRSADELAASGKTYRIKTLDILFGNAEARSGNQMTPADRAAETMFHIVCIATRINNAKNPRQTSDPEGEASRLVAPGYRDPIGQPEVYVTSPWLTDTLLDRLLPGYVPFDWSKADLSRLGRS